MTAKQSQNETRLLVIGDRALFFLSLILATALIAYGTYAICANCLIQGEKPPLSAEVPGCWAPVNIIFLVLTVYFAAPVFLIRQKDLDPGGHTSQIKEITLIGLLLEVIIALAALFTFAVTQNFKLPAVSADRWTPLMLVFLVVCWGIDAALIRYRENQRREKYEDGEE